ncbi:hypothetical protein BD777DRAFT_101998, partial [Yarrowia lipolytica]
PLRCLLQVWQAWPLCPSLPKRPRRRCSSQIWPNPVLLFLWRPGSPVQGLHRWPEVLQLWLHGPCFQGVRRGPEPSVLQLQEARPHCHQVR